MTSGKMPVLFIGHGSPMNAIEENDFTKTLSLLGEKIPKPKAVLCISAHWLTDGTWVTHMPKPKTIHDFYGFPQALFDVQYPAPGDQKIADQIREMVKNPAVELDEGEWGLDHGTWSVLRHMYPKADIPVLQLSVDVKEPGSYHLTFGQKLKPLRDEGILILGSGNIVHNLRKIKWEDDVEAYDWAKEFDEWSKQMIEKRDFQSLANDATSFEAGRLSVPTMDHYYPLLYTLGAADPDDALKFEYEGLQNASISMRSLSFGRK